MSKFSFEKERVIEACYAALYDIAIYRAIKFEELAQKKVYRFLWMSKDIEQARQDVLNDESISGLCAAWRNACGTQVREVNMILQACQKTSGQFHVYLSHEDFSNIESYYKEK